jgi:hypothetical protein
MRFRRVNFVWLTLNQGDDMNTQNSLKLPFSAKSAPAAGWISKLAQAQPVLMLAVVVNIGLTLLGLAGLALDPRTVLNAPVWAKTTKFALSVIAYTGTLAWMFTYLRSRPRAARVLGFAIGVILIGEMAMLVLQAVRGVPMHYNYSTPFDTALFSVMAGTITFMWVLTAIGAVLLLREHIASPALAAGIRLGLVIALIGMALAFGMTSPNATQLAALQAGRQLDLIGAHNVNALVDGQTRMLPFLGWNMDGGDLRIAHFVGIHALQVIPLAAVWIERRAAHLSKRRRVALVGIAAFAYLGLTLLTFVQALRDQSIIAPDVLTLAAGAALLVISALSALVVARTGRKATS